MLSKKNIHLRGRQLKWQPIWIDNHFAVKTLISYSTTKTGIVESGSYTLLDYVKGNVAQINLLRYSTNDSEIWWRHSNRPRYVCEVERLWEQPP